MKTYLMVIFLLWGLSYTQEENRPINIVINHNQKGSILDILNSTSIVILVIFSIGVMYPNLNNVLLKKCHVAREYIFLVYYQFYKCIFNFCHENSSCVFIDSAKDVDKNDLLMNVFSVMNDTITVSQKTLDDGKKVFQSLVDNRGMRFFSKKELKIFTFFKNDNCEEVKLSFLKEYYPKLNIDLHQMENKHEIDEDITDDRIANVIYRFCKDEKMFYKLFCRFIRKDIQDFLYDIDYKRYSLDLTDFEFKVYEKFKLCELLNTVASRVDYTDENCLLENITNPLVTTNPITIDIK